MSLVDLAIERGSDDNAEVTVPISAIAEKFIEVYWRQSVPYVAADIGTAGVLLHQNKGTQAKAVLLLAEFRQHAATLPAARRSKQWATLVRRFASLLDVMPLWKLQRIGHEYVEFLYRRGAQANEITLLPGVASHLRQRAPLIRRLAQSEWLAFLLARSQNRPVLGNAVGLSEFLFGDDRAALGLRLAKPLASLQSGRCFYCGETAAAPVVDHFIPWSLYPRDLVHNFVAAHATCNSRKSNLLGGEQFLSRWAEFVDRRDADLSALGSEIGMLVDRPTSIAVARWSYEQAEQAGAEVWLGGTRYGHLGSEWQECLSSRVLCDNRFEGNYFVALWMADRLSTKRRSWNMSRIRGRDTAPEMQVRSTLHRAGYRFRLHSKLLPARPDIVLPKYRTVVFVHGCFWHRHSRCRYAYTPKSRVAFWNAKFDSNVERDRRTARRLRRLGWKVVTVWECEANQPQRWLHRLPSVGLIRTSSQ